MNNEVELSWQRFLNPEILRTNLVVASLYITTFEMLKDSIISRIRDFFTDGFDENGWIINGKYKSDVLSLNKSELYASLKWLKNMKVINQDDIEKFNKIKKCRNNLTHEITNFIFEGTTIDPLPLFSKITELLLKIEKWWVLNVEIPTNPHFESKNVDENGIIPGPIMTIHLLTDIALGTEEESTLYYNEFVKRKK